MYALMRNSPVAYGACTIEVIMSSTGRQRASVHARRWRASVSLIEHFDVVSLVAGVL
jgi:hypothetical protein